MGYQVSLDNFTKGKMFDSKGKIHHNSGNTFKLFPFIANNNSDPVLDLDPLVGDYLCRIEGKKPKNITPDELVDKLMEDTEISPGSEEFFNNAIRQLYFTSEGMMRPLNLQFIEQKTCTEPSENRIAEYLVDILGNVTSLKSILTDAHKTTMASGNVLESFVLSKLEYDDFILSPDSIHYFRIINSLQEVFEEDFAYVLENPKRLREYLVILLEIYFFSYTAQSCLQLSRFLDGERTSNVPVYFCLEWEKTSQSRLCFVEGWQKLQASISKIFAHAITLEILNHTEAESELVDYIRLNELITDETEDARISKQIDGLTEVYRNAIGDCVEMNELRKKDTTQGLTADSVRFLFDSIRVQFENTGRTRAYGSYANKFEQYCRKFLKSRGRSGMMLNLSEENLIFLTKMCIKNNEQMRLKDVFTAFERRGIFLDDISKEQATEYFERLNLIEKKSDSGDAKYVKRIL